MENESATQIGTRAHTLTPSPMWVLRTHTRETKPLPCFVPYSPVFNQSGTRNIICVCALVLFFGLSIRWSRSCTKFHVHSETRDRYGYRNERGNFFLISCCWMNSNFSPPLFRLFLCSFDTFDAIFNRCRILYCPPVQFLQDGQWTAVLPLFLD